MKGEKNVVWQPETQPKGKPPVEKTKGAETTQKLIDADDLIAWAEIVPLTGDGGIDINDFEEKLKSMPTIDAEPQWIPVSERLPEEKRTVIASTEYGVFPEARYTKEDGWEWAYESGADYWEKIAEVKAWMPLPQPYEAEDEKTN